MRLLSILLLSTTVASALTLHGSGATFPEPLYREAIAQYTKLHKDQPVTYDGVGSEIGRALITQGRVDFGATEVPTPEFERRNAIGELLHVPTALGAVVAAYNLPGLKEPLRLNAAVLSDIYDGSIRTWNHPSIARINVDVKLPALPIIPVHRSDGSGTTAVWLDFLASSDPKWAKIDASPFTGGVGARGNSGLSKMLQDIPGAIGYTTLAQAQKSKLAFARIRNASGQYVLPTLDSVRAAASRATLDDDGEVNLVNSPVATGYPVATYTYVVLLREQKYNGRSLGQARALKEFVTYLVTRGQALNDDLGFAALPSTASRYALRQLNRLTFDGDALR